MKYTISKRLLFTTAALSTASLALAQEAAPPSGSNALEEIIVTARRTEERLQDVPISMTVFSQEQLTDRNIVNAGDLAVYTPSLSVNNRYGPENTNFAIRGFTQEQGTSPSVAVYFADVVAPRSSASLVAANGAGPGAMFDLQNVQVLKGPQGTLFGRNTTGGAVLLVPQKPTSEFGGYIEGSTGNYNARRLQGVLNAPINDSMRFRIGIDYNKRDGYLNNVSPVGPRDFADVNYWAARASLVWDITPNIENYTIASYSDSDTNGFMPKVYTSAFSARTSARVRTAVNDQLAATAGDFYDIENAVPDARQHIKQLGLFNTTTARLTDNLTLKNIASYQEYRQSMNADIFGDYSITSSAPLTVFYNGTSIYAAPGRDNQQQSTMTEELQLQGKTSDDRLIYQIGGYAEKSDPLGGFQGTLGPASLDCTDVLTYNCTDIEGRNAGAEGRVGSISEASSEIHYTNLGVYGQGTYKLTDQWSLTGGIRYTSDKVESDGRALKANFPAPNTPLWTCSVPSPVTVGGSSAAIRDNPALCNVHREVTSKKPTWLIDVDYKPIDDILLYAKYARGYRQGSLSLSGYGLETWGPEKVDAYEIGTKTSFGGPIPGTFNIAAFYNDFSEQQLQLVVIGCSAAELISKPAQCPFIASPASGIANAGKSTISGVEIDTSIRPLRDLRLDFNYAYLDTELKSITLPPIPIGFSSLLTRSVVGGPLPNTPKNKLSVTATYSLPLNQSVGIIAVAATYTYQSSIFTNVSSPVAFQTLPSQKNLNLNVNWTSLFGHPIDLGLFATNVTDEKFYSTVLGANSNGYDAAILSQPRMYGVRLKYHFGG